MYYLVELSPIYTCIQITGDMRNNGCYACVMTVACIPESRFPGGQFIR